MIEFLQIWKHFMVTSAVFHEEEGLVTFWSWMAEIRFAKVPEIWTEASKYSFKNCASERPVSYLACEIDYVLVKRCGCNDYIYVVRIAFITPVDAAWKSQRLRICSWNRAKIPIGTNDAIIATGILVIHSGGGLITVQERVLRQESSISLWDISDDFEHLVDSSSRKTGL